jgi:hypothetical protein
LRAEPYENAIARARDDLRTGAKGTASLVPVLVDAMKAYATMVRSAAFSARCSGSTGPLCIGH